MERTGHFVRHSDDWRIWVKIMIKIRKHFYFSGAVQGVGFRYRARYAAESLGLTGWVRNLPDGRVEMEAQGNGAAIERLISELENSRFIRIEDVEEQELACSEEECRFRITGY